MNMKKIYRRVAKEHGVSVEEVKREMEGALEWAYRSPADDGITAAWQKQVERKAIHPSAEEFLRYAAEDLKKH